MVSARSSHEYKTSVAHEIRRDSNHLLWAGQFPLPKFISENDTINRKKWHFSEYFFRVNRLRTKNRMFECGYATFSVQLVVAHTKTVSLSPERCRPSSSSVFSGWLILIRDLRTWLKYFTIRDIEHFSCLLKMLNSFLVVEAIFGYR